jgi:NADPH:quinone reductase-like Zn-dependent oxidoreductase
MSDISPLPVKMKAVFVENPGGPLVLEEVDIPHPGPGEVLIRISAAPVNPSDLVRIKNAHLEHDLDSFIPGLEGSGTVVSAGKGMLPRLWLGKRVCCSSQSPAGGTWAEYMVTSAAKCFPLSKKVTDEQGAMSLVNPLTALAFFDITKQGKHKAIINNAAASSLGRMVELLGEKYHVPVINLVRDQKQAVLLKNLGSRHVLYTSDPMFSEQLGSLSSELKATILFDSVCGKQLGDIISVLPYGSSVVIYGNLSGEEQPTFNPRNLLTNNITISGFYLGNQTKENGLVKNILNIRKVSQLMQTGMQIKIRNRYPLASAQEAVDTYLGNMSEGKVLLIPSLD